MNLNHPNGIKINLANDKPEIEGDWLRIGKSHFDSSFITYVKELSFRVCSIGNTIAEFSFVCDSVMYEIIIVVSYHSDNDTQEQKDKMIKELKLFVLKLIQKQFDKQHTNKIFI